MSLSGNDKQYTYIENHADGRFETEGRRREYQTPVTSEEVSALEWQIMHAISVAIKNNDYNINEADSPGQRSFIGVRFRSIIRYLEPCTSERLIPEGDLHERLTIMWKERKLLKGDGMFGPLYNMPGNSERIEERLKQDGILKRYSLPSENVIKI